MNKPATPTEPAMPSPSEPDTTAQAETSKSVKVPFKKRPKKTFHEQYPRIARLFGTLLQKQDEYFARTPVTPIAETLEDDDICFEFHLKLTGKHGKPTIIRGTDTMSMVLDTSMHAEALANFSDTLRLKMVRPAETAFHRLMMSRVNRSNTAALEPGQPPNELSRSNS